MCISECSGMRYLRLFELTGDVQPKSQRHGPQPLPGKFEQLILLSQKHWHILAPVARRAMWLVWSDSVYQLFAGLHKMGCYRVIPYVAIQWSEEQRVRFIADISANDPSIIWIDESGCDVWNSMRKFAYILRGTPQLITGYLHEAHDIQPSLPYHLQEFWMLF